MNLRLAILVSMSLCMSCSGKYFKSRALNPESLKNIQCLALKLDNLSGQPRAAEAVGEMLMQSLEAERVFNFMHPKFLEEQIAEEASKGSGMLQRLICKAAQKLGAQGILQGNVTEFGYVEVNPGSFHPRVAMQLSLYDAQSCNVVWEAKVADGSILGSASGLAMESVDKITKKLESLLNNRILKAFFCGSKGAGSGEACRPDKSGKVDYVSCPQEIPVLKIGKENVSLEGNEIVYNRRIGFMPGKSLLLPEAENVIKDTVKFIRDNNIRSITVESYIIGEESPDLENLSNHRAGRVKSDLVKKGLGAVGVGVRGVVIPPEIAKDKDVPSLRILVEE